MRFLHTSSISHSVDIHTHHRGQLDGHLLSERTPGRAALRRATAIATRLLRKGRRYTATVLSSVLVLSQLTFSAVGPQGVRGTISGAVVEPKRRRRRRRYRQTHKRSYEARSPYRSNGRGWQIPPA